MTNGSKLSTPTLRILEWKFDLNKMAKLCGTIGTKFLSHTPIYTKDIGGLPPDHPSESPGDTGSYVLVAENLARASRCKAVETLTELNSSVPGPWRKSVSTGWTEQCEQGISSALWRSMSPCHAVAWGSRCLFPEALMITMVLSLSHPVARNTPKQSYLPMGKQT